MSLRLGRSRRVFDSPHRDQFYQYVVTSGRRPVLEAGICRFEADHTDHFK
jgi:hypothetical protein